MIAHTREEETSMMLNWIKFLFEVTAKPVFVSPKGIEVLRFNKSA